jgi:glycosyltransferase involved in cell wall biosynthesis
MTDTQPSPFLSLVITSFTIERLNDVYALLDSIKNQTYKNMETIFVTERSFDLYNKVSAYIRDKAIPNTKVMFNDGKPGLSAARNLGISKAIGEIIAFVDDDVVLFPEWADEMIKTYSADSIIGATGTGLPLWEDATMSWLPEEFYWIISCTAFAGWNEPRAVRSAWGMNMSFRREAFQHCGFSENFGQTTGEKEAWKAGPVDDAEFSINLRLRTGKSITYNPLVRVQHKVYTYRLSSKFIRGQAYWQGYSKALFKRLYSRDADTTDLARERDLLRRIFFNLLPRTAKAFFGQPKRAIKIFALTASVLFYVALGYSAGAAPFLAGFTRRYFSS